MSEACELQRLLELAWAHEAHAYSIGGTQVGAAVRTADGSMFGGCNVEHQFRSHDIHAEANAISSMVAAGHIDLSAVVVVARRERMSPCGGCLDWIMQFGGGGCQVAWQCEPKGQVFIHRAAELMPYYPK